jgi:alpha-beta hydrolase superfamily lysophospholipase
MSMNATRRLSAILLALAVAACASTQPSTDRARLEAQKIEKGSVLAEARVDPALQNQIFALDPERVSDSDVRTVLAAGPTPRIVNLHGGIYPVHLVMESFARFLIGMGYPESKVRHPGDGRLSHSPYENSAQIAGVIAWYYERDGVRPLIVGHSQGGIQAVKVLHELAGDYSDAVRVWNPLTDSAENRTTITDPLTGRERPVVGLKVGYASAVGAGGAALLLPNQWSMAGRLRTIPDTVEDFTGYSLGVDLIAWDLPGVGGTYRATGTARVRNVELPASYSHVTVAATADLAEDRAMREWLNAYVPGQNNGFPADAVSVANALWAADVWYSIKKHWVIEAQRFLRAKNAVAMRQ